MLKREGCTMFNITLSPDADPKSWRIPYESIQIHKKVLRGDCETVTDLDNMEESNEVSATNPRAASARIAKDVVAAEPSRQSAGCDLPKGGGPDGQPLNPETEGTPPSHFTQENAHE